MAEEHYFTSKPADEDSLRTIRTVLAGREAEVVTAGGVFSPEHLDTGTRVLLDAVPAPPATGDLLDLGCGWGPVAISLALRSPDATVWAVDVNERALDLVRRNAARLGLGNIRTALPDEVPAEVRFATIWSNPPIRVGKAELHALLERWLPRLAETDADDPAAVGDHRAAGASAWLVVAKHLGAESLQRWIVESLGLDAERADQSKGFRVLEVRRAG